MISSVVLPLLSWRFTSTETVRLIRDRPSILSRLSIYSKPRNLYIMDCAPLLWHWCQNVREQKAAFNGVRERQTLLAFQRAINVGLGSIY